MAILAIVTKKSFWMFIIVLTLVWIPYGLHKIGLNNEYISFMTNQFFVFFIIFFVGIIFIAKYIAKPNPWILGLGVGGMAFLSFIYVLIFYGI